PFPVCIKRGSVQRKTTATSAVKFCCALSMLVISAIQIPTETRVGPASACGRSIKAGASALRASWIDIAKKIRNGKWMPFIRSLEFDVNELDGARAKHPPNANDSCGRGRGSGDALRFDRNQ